MADHTTNQVHFRVSPCMNMPGDWGKQSEDPNEVTCPECAPVAAKYKRGSALQAFEEAETAHRNAEAEYKRASVAEIEARRNRDMAKSRMEEARKIALALIGQDGMRQ